MSEVAASPRASARVDALGSARGSAQEAPASARVSPRGQENISARSNPTPRDTIDEMPVTTRPYMDTARVHTALAALAAEKKVLMSKLAFIDSALEAEGKKKKSLVNSTKK